MTTGLSANFVMSWTPSEDQGPSRNAVSIRVAETNSRSFEVTSLSVPTGLETIFDEVNKGARADRARGLDA